MRQSAGVEILPQHGLDGFVAEKIGIGARRRCDRLGAHSFTPKRRVTVATIAR